MHIQNIRSATTVPIKKVFDGGMESSLAACMIDDLAFPIPTPPPVSCGFVFIIFCHRTYVFSKLFDLLLGSLARDTVKPRAAAVTQRNSEVNIYLHRRVRHAKRPDEAGATSQAICQSARAARNVNLSGAGKRPGARRRRPGRENVRLR